MGVFHLQDHKIAAVPPRNSKSPTHIFLHLIRQNFLLPQGCQGPSFEGWGWGVRGGGWGMEGGGTGSGSTVQLYLPHLPSITLLATDRPHSSDARCCYECRHTLLSWESQAWRPGHFSSIGFTSSFVSVQMFEEITTGLLLLHIQD